MIYKIKKFLRPVIYYVLPCVLLTLSVLYPGQLYNKFGEYAIYSLGIILFVKPIAAILKINLLWEIVSYRKELGLLVFWLFFFHAAGMSYLYGFYMPETWQYFTAPTYWGIVAGLGTTILAVTSNSYFIKLLKRNWKRLHYSAYFVYFAALMHISLIREEYFWNAVIFITFAILKIVEFNKLRKTKVVSGFPSARE